MTRGSSLTTGRVHSRSGYAPARFSHRKLGVWYLRKVKVWPLIVRDQWVALNRGRPVGMAVSQARAAISS